MNTAQEEEGAHADAQRSALASRVRAAVEARTPLLIQGGASKAFYGAPRTGTVLDTRIHHGILAYEPTELVITARAGTPLAEIDAALEGKGQHLAFEPPSFGGAATLGGALATGLSGPGRAARGALRDFVLGVSVVDGRGRVLRFGGTVMKNVAGFDVTRLVAGSMGTLGVILDVSLKVLPRPAHSVSLQFELDQVRAIELANRIAAKSFPITASVWQGGLFTLRLSGAAAAVEAACTRLGGRRLSDAAGAQLWTLLREQTYPFFAGDTPLWRLSVPSTTAAFRLEDEPLIEWGGALRWFRSTARPQAIHAVARERGGHATLFRGSPAERAAAFAETPRAEGLVEIEERLRREFDPHQLFNRGPATESVH